MKSSNAMVRWWSDADLRRAFNLGLQYHSRPPDGRPFRPAGLIACWTKLALFGKQGSCLSSVTIVSEKKESENFDKYAESGYLSIAALPWTFVKEMAMVRLPPLFLLAPRRIPKVFAWVKLTP